jgi:hypothetical protein
VSPTVWVCGEGRRDHGTEGRGGALVGLARQRLPTARLVSRRVTIRGHGGFGRKPAGRDLDRAVRGLKGHPRRLALALLDALREGADGVVFVHDTDSHEPTAHRSALEALQRARRQVVEHHAVPPSAIGVAMPMVEAWLLGDAAALPAASPERDPERRTRARGGDRYAKDLLENALRDCGFAEGAEGYGELAARLDPERVAKACPRSFAPFLEELDALAAAMGGGSGTA